MTIDREAFLSEHDPYPWQRIEPKPAKPPAPIPAVRSTPQRPPVRDRLDAAVRIAEMRHSAVREQSEAELAAARQEIGALLATYLTIHSSNRLPATLETGLAGVRAKVTLPFTQLDGTETQCSFPAGTRFDQIKSAFLDGLRRQAEWIGDLATRMLLVGGITAEQHSAITQSLDLASPPPAPPVNVTVRPVIDLSKGDTEIVRDRAGKVIGSRRVDRLEG